jgi:lipoyl(octanoyl) transferase
MIISTLMDFGLQAEQQPGMTGVWINPNSNPDLPQEKHLADQRPLKIASIGVKVDSHGISRHGFALNVNPDMAYWEGIIACGLDGYGETSLSELISPVPQVETVIERLVYAFGEHFLYRMLTKPL